MTPTGIRWYRSNGIVADKEAADRTTRCSRRPRPTSLRFAAQEMAAGRPGSLPLLAQLAECLFMEAVRRYLALVPPPDRGWLAGFSDPVVGRALILPQRRGAIHRQADDGHAQICVHECTRHCFRRWSRRKELTASRPGLPSAPNNRACWHVHNAFINPESIMRRWKRSTSSRAAQSWYRPLQSSMRRLRSR